MNKFGIHYAYWGDRWNVDLCERIRLAADAGFNVLEVTPPDYMINLDKGKMDVIKKCAAQHDIEMSFCIGFPRSKDMASADKAVREAGIEHSKRMLEAVHYMGGKILGGILYSWWPCLYDHEITPEYKQDCWKRSVESVQTVIPLAESYGIEYAVEMVNRFEQFIVNSVEEGRQFCKDVDSPNAKLLLDVFHANIEEDSIPDAILNAGPLLAHIHISENNRRLPGSGSNIPWREIMAALKKINFQGRIVLEPFVAAGGPVGNDLRIWRNLEGDISGDGRHEALKKSLEFVKSMTKRSGICSDPLERKGEQWHIY